MENQYTTPLPAIGYAIGKNGGGRRTPGYCARRDDSCNFVRLVFHPLLCDGVPFVPVGGARINRLSDIFETISARALIR
jgi:hypothetical protein